MTYFDKSYQEARETELKELLILQEVFQLKTKLEDEKMHKMAYLNSVAVSKKTEGKKQVRVFPDFKSFYNENDYEYSYVDDNLNKIKKEIKKEESDNVRMYLKMKKYREEKNKKRR